MAEMSGDLAWRKWRTDPSSKLDLQSSDIGETYMKWQGFMLGDLTSLSMSFSHLMKLIGRKTVKTYCTKKKRYGKYNMYIIEEI